MRREILTASIGAALTMAGCGAVAAVTPATAPEALYENTLRVSNSVGDIDIFINRQGDYRTVTFKGGSATGTWRMDDGKLCLTQQLPEPPEALKRESCTMLQGSRVGDRWERKSNRGRFVTISIVKGRERLPTP